jgi:hypothetical protein
MILGRICLVTSLFFGLRVPLPEQSQKTTKRIQMVFADFGVGAGTETVMDVREGQLRLRKPIFLKGHGYRVDGLKFYPDWKQVESRYREYQVVDHLNVKDNVLYFNDQPVQLPQDVKMRQVYQAIFWNGWVICLGRTSNTDREAALRPPFVETELITFSASERVAHVKWLSAFAPNDTRLYILDSSTQAGRVAGASALGR